MSSLSFPLFLVSDQSEEMDIESPDVVIEIVPEPSIIEAIQEPVEAQQSVTFIIEACFFSEVSDAYVDLLQDNDPDVHLLLESGPTLSVIMDVANSCFISPKLTVHHD